MTGKILKVSTSGLRMIPTAESFASPFALEEPMWIPDKETTKCESCQLIFDFLNRRHHCRRCGKCFCNRCCSHKMQLQRMYFIDSVRQCYDCAVISRMEQEFYEKSLKILMTGTEQSVAEGNSVSSEPREWGNYLCRLTPDSRYIDFIDKKETETSSPPAKVLLTKVIGAQVLTEPQSPSGVSGRQMPTGLALKYKDEEDSSIIHDIVLNSIDQKSSAPWLSCTHKALKMIFESRQQKIQE